VAGVLHLYPYDYSPAFDEGLRKYVAEQMRKEAEEGKGGSEGGSEGESEGGGEGGSEGGGGGGGGGGEKPEGGSS